MDTHERILELLLQRGIRFKIHEHEAVRTIDDAERIAPDLVHALLKTVVFKIKDSFYVLAAVRCRDKIDYRKLAAALNINRRQLRSLSPEEIRVELGYEVGGVGPIPVRGDVMAIFDSNLRNAHTVYCGSGRNTLTLELEFSELLRGSNGQIHSIARELSEIDSSDQEVQLRK